MRSRLLVATSLLSGRDGRRLLLPGYRRKRMPQVCAMPPAPAHRHRKARHIRQQVRGICDDGQGVGVDASHHLQCVGHRRWRHGEAASARSAAGGQQRRAARESSVPAIRSRVSSPAGSPAAAPPATALMRHNTPTDSHLNDHEDKGQAEGSNQLALDLQKARAGGAGRWRSTTQWAHAG